MTEYVFDYDGWAAEMKDAMPEHVWFGIYMAIKGVMHRRKHEPIVRCRDCKQGVEAHYKGKTIIDCHGPLVQTWDYWQDEPLVNEVNPDGFCAWGERRDA